MENNITLKQETLEMFVTELLHIDDINKNKLIDFTAGDASKVFVLEKEGYESKSRYILNTLKVRYGLPGNTVMRKSSKNPTQEQLIGDDINCVDWHNLDGDKDTAALHKFIDDVYKEISLKGNNPLFLSIGALKWKISTQDSFKIVSSPLLIVPIRLIRTGTYQTPVYIEFVNDDIYLNPCLIAKLRQVWGDKLVENFPHPNGKECKDLDAPVDLEKLDNGVDYFSEVENYISKQKRTDINVETVFDFDKDSVVILQYNHDELCMYYDIKRNKTRIFDHPLIQRIFTKHETFLPSPQMREEPQCVLPHDSVQEDIIRRVVNGESLIIKGPPGTGKTLTITNMIASLLAANKKVMLSSQKPAAMSEVYAKLPPQLRKFVMMLSSETEAQAAKLNPTDVRKDFNDLLDEKRKFRSPLGAYNDRTAGLSQTKLAEKEIAAYRTIMFDIANNSDIIGLNYFDALDAYCKIEAEPVKFCDQRIAYAMPRDIYHHFAGEVSSASKHFDLLGKNHPLNRSPWIPADDSTLDGVDIEALLVEYSGLAREIDALLGELSQVFDSAAIRGEDLPTAVALCLLKNKISVEQIAALISPEAINTLKGVAEAYRAYISGKASVSETIKTTDATAAVGPTATLRAMDTAIKIKDFLWFYENFDTCKIAADKVNVSFFKEYTEAHMARKARVAELEREFYSIFRRDVSYSAIAEDAAVLVKKYDAKNKPEKPGMMDFAGKKAYANLAPLGYEPAIPFSEVITALSYYEEIKRISENEKQARTRICKVFQRTFTDEQFDILDTILEFAAQAETTPDKYVCDLERVKDKINSVIKTVECTGEETIADLLDAVDAASLVNSVKQALSLVPNAEQIFGELREEKIIPSAEIAYAIYYSYDLGIFGKSEADMATRIGGFYTLGRYLIPKIDSVNEKIDALAGEYFPTYYSRHPFETTFGDLAVLRDEAENRDVLYAATEYLSITRNKANTAINLSNFFRPFECGVRKKGEDYTFTDLFEHSILNLAIEAKLSSLGKYRYGLGNRITSELQRLDDGSDLISRAVLLITESICFSRINENDPDFAFLNAEKGINETLRKFFKNYAKAIMKLKKCFILSPSTVSVLMRNDVFSDFDVVIVDEASQLEPVAILPVLYRSKQVVLVGDEWQMPPIKHFVTRGDRMVAGDDGSMEILDPDTSVLGLALNNCAFPATQLCCHYRSRTESLIAFSQERFYDYMRTFPTANPNADGLGFKDVLVEDGYIDNKKNVPEALAVVRELNEHFDKYYNRGTETLRESVGIVAFGEEQVKEIRRRIEDDKELEAKIQKAIANFNDLPEKLIFFKTIETVQGQEADHLILSITYGRQKDGKIVQTFGQLNRGMGEGSKLGLCIFNVAVTRAKSSVTVVHSIRAEQITNENIKYIGDYLRIVKQFSEGGKAQFVSKTELAPGFISQVVAHIESLGIDPSRIVLDFGVTEGSVRIPIAILSKDNSSAIAGIWCEKNIDSGTDYLDYNQRYFNELTASRGWKLHRMYIHDWVDNNASERKALTEFISIASQAAEVANQ